MSTQPRPWPAVCTPVCWKEGSSSFLAYHHGWTDARIYDVVEIYHDGRPQSAFAGYVATVDDFGNLVPTRRPRLDHEANRQIVEAFLAAIDAKLAVKP